MGIISCLLIKIMSDNKYIPSAEWNTYSTEEKLEKLKSG